MNEPEAIYGIIGNPVNHSLSPLMHNTAFKVLNVNASYRLFPLQEDELQPFFEDLKEADNPIFGLNVTVPYKEKVLPYMDSLNPFAQKVGAVNTIVIAKNRKLHGFNTDGPGFLAHMNELGFNPKEKRVAIIGAGGTTRAILSVFCMIEERPDSIRVYNRTPENLKALVDDLGQRVNLDIVQQVNAIDDLNIELADLLINTTSVGLSPEDPSLIDPSLLHKDMIVYDVIYRPAKTRLLQDAEAKGCKISNGLAMLYYQGVLSLQHWAGIEIDQRIKNRMREKLEDEVYGEEAES